MDDRKDLPHHENLIAANSQHSKTRAREFTEEKLRCQLKTIHFPGGTGQRRQAQYQIAAIPSGIPGFTIRTKIIFVADANDPDWEFILSDHPESVAIPDYLVNKVLEQELSGCRLDLVEVFFVTQPNSENRRKVYRWNFKVDRDNPKGEAASRVESTSWLDLLTAMVKTPGTQDDSPFLTVNQLAGMYPVLVAANKPRLSEEEGLEILQSIRLDQRSL